MDTGYTSVVIRAHESAIIQLIRRQVIFGPFSSYNIAENDPQDLNISQKDASSNSTQSVIKISPDTKVLEYDSYEESYGYFSGMPAVRPRELRIRGMCVCVTHIQLLTEALSGEPLEIET
jgi:hypothetical protein